MNVIGIIAEYNPFHNGHAYQIAHVKKNLHADYIVVAASGDYVQRGEPALLDKYTRARMALSSGADLVLELPVLWSTASAELFADAGISLFEKTGCVNGICFGAESGDLALLRRIADVLADEPAALKASLKRNLKSGNTFPKAREAALLSYFADAADQDGALPVSTETLSSLLASPNNILALEYLKSLRRRASSITPYLLKREGAAYPSAPAHPKSRHPRPRSGIHSSPVAPDHPKILPTGFCIMPCRRRHCPSCRTTGQIFRCCAPMTFPAFWVICC